MAGWQDIHTQGTGVGLDERVHSVPPPHGRSGQWVCCDGVVRPCVDITCFGSHSPCSRGKIVGLME
jgi:hypothetical protein